MRSPIHVIVQTGIRVLAACCVVFSALTVQASPWTPPADFATNFIDYPAVDKLPTVSTPGPLTTAARIAASGTYYLANDIYARAEGFVIDAKDVTLDLRGHKIVYACENYQRAYGISLPPTYNHALFFPRGDFAAQGNDNFTLKDSVGGGAIIKGIGFPAQASSAVFGYRVNGLTIQDVILDHSGIDASGIELHYPKGNITITGITTTYEYVRDGIPIIDPNLLNYPPDNTSTFYWVSNRHSKYVGSIQIIHGQLSGCTIANNTLSSSPQQGIFIQDYKFPPTQGARDASFFDSPATFPYVYDVYNNTIKMNVKITNGYGIKVDARNANIHDNSITGYGAGFHVGGEYVYLHHNTVDVSEGSNPEYKQRLWAHGIKLEGTSLKTDKRLPNQCLIRNNKVTVRTRGPKDYVDTSFWYTNIDGKITYFGNNGDGRALDFSPALGTWNEVRDNVFRALLSGSDHPKPFALRYTDVKKLDAVNTSVIVENNTFETNGYFIGCDYPPAGVDWQSIVVKNNAFTNAGGLADAWLFYFSGSNTNPIGTIEITNPLAEPATVFQENPNYKTRPTMAGGRLKIAFESQFCGKPGESLLIESSSLGTIFKGALGADGKHTEKLLARDVSVASGSVTDTSFEYTVTLGGLTKSWKPELSFGACGGMPIPALLDVSPAP